MIKKTLFLCACCMLALSLLLAGCAPGGPDAPSAPDTPADPETPTEPETPDAEAADVNILALKGPTAMGMVRFMEQADNGALTDNNYQFTITAATDEVSAALIAGRADIAAVPANLAAVLYNNTEGAVQVLAINTLGVLYIVESGDSVASVADLRGKTIYASGKNATPEYALHYILSQSGIDPAADVTIEWKSEHTECLAALMAEENAIAMLPQPFVTTAQAKSENIRVALDLTEEWDKLQAGVEPASALITGVVVARRAFIEAQPQAVAAFLDHYQDSVAFVNNDIEAAAELVGAYDIVTAEVARQALPACNIVCIEGDELQEKLSGYLAVLLEQNAKSIGGALPADDFYYSR